MSQLLGSESFLIPLGATVAETKDILGGVLTAHGWQIVGESVALVSITAPGCTTPGALVDNLVGVQTGYGALPFTVVIQLPAAAIITKYDIHGAEQSNFATLSPKSWTLSYGDSASGPWTVVDTRTNEPAFTKNEQRTYAVAPGPTARVFWRLNITAGQSESVVLSELRLWQSTGEFVCDRDYLYLIPPADEAIGNSNSREVVILGFTGTSVSVQSAIQLLNPMPWVVSMAEKTAGAVAAGIYNPNGAPFALTASISGFALTVTAASGVLGAGSPIYGPGIPNGCYIVAPDTGTGGPGTYTVNAVAYLAEQAMTSQSSQLTAGAAGLAGSTAKDNLRAAYVALRSSVDAGITDWEWHYSKPSPQNADDPLDYIIGVRRTTAPLSPPTFLPNANVNYSVVGRYVEAGLPFLDFAPGQANPASASMALTSDLVTGFIYFFSVSKRGFTLGLKLTSSYQGCLHACYADHALALSVMPGSFDPRFISPTELLVGFDGTQAENFSTAYAAKAMVLPAMMGNEIETAFDAGIGDLPLNGFRYRDQFVDAANRSESFLLSASGLFNGAINAAADDFQVHRMVMDGLVATTGPGVLYMPLEYSATHVVPALKIEDWFKFRGTAANEGLIQAADTVQMTTLAQNMDATTAYASLALVSVTGLAPAGFVVIEDESIKYAGLNIGANTLTGVTRAQYGTKKQNHWTGDPVAQALWYTVINGGALLNGPTKPVA